MTETYRHLFAQCERWRSWRESLTALGPPGAPVMGLDDPPVMWTVLRARPAVAGFREAIQFAAEVDAEAAKRRRERAA